MKIREVRASILKFTAPAIGKPKATPRQPAWLESAEVANPMSRYPRFKRQRSSWRPRSTAVACRITAEDGTWGLGMTRYGAPVAALINEHFAPLLVGEPCLATERIWDMLVRLSSPYGAAGLASYAISAVDLALWDLKGKVLKRPVYELLGGPARDQQPCYATGNDTAWHIELGFKATKLACPYGPADGLDGLEKNAELVARARDLIGPKIDLMLDCWMAFDLEYAVRLAERLRPYGLRWLEDCLTPEDLDGHIELRRRLPWQGLATGEHWYTPSPFAYAVSHRVADVLQPDVEWVGGVTACVKICHIAETAGIAVIPHAGMNSPYGQHLSFAMPNSPWGEYFVGSPPGVPLDDMTVIPGMAQPKHGSVVPNDAPGFGLEITDRWLESVTA